MWRSIPLAPGWGQLRRLAASGPGDVGEGEGGVTASIWAGWLVDRGGVPWDRAHRQRMVVRTGDGGGPLGHPAAWKCLVRYPEAVGQKEPASHGWLPPRLQHSAPTSPPQTSFPTAPLSVGAVTPKLLSDSPLVHSHGFASSCSRTCSFPVWVPTLFAARFQLPRTVSADSQGSLQTCGMRKSRRRPGVASWPP